MQQVVRTSFMQIKIFLAQLMFILVFVVVAVFIKQFVRKPFIFKTLLKNLISDHSPQVINLYLRFLLFRIKVYVLEKEWLGKGFWKLEIRFPFPARIPFRKLKSLPECVPEVGKFWYKFQKLEKELFIDKKYQFLNPYIIATWCRRPLIFPTLSYVRSKN